MPESKTVARARRDKRAGKAPSTQAGEFVREEIDHIREGQHGARSAKQAIAIGLSKARRAGVDLQPPARGKTSTTTRKSAARDMARGQVSSKRQATSRKRSESRKRSVSRKRSEASKKALRRESTAAASPASLASHARSAAKRRSPAQRSDAARRAARTQRAEATRHASE